MACKSDNHPFTDVICSGHGQCVDGTCICDEGWTGLGDFQRISGVGCPINKSTIKYWSIVNLIGSVFSVGVVIRYMTENGLLHIKRIHENRVRICLALLTMNIGAIIYSVAKICDQERFAFGGDATVATGFSLAVLGGVVSFSSYLTIVLKFFRGYSRIINKTRSVHKNGGHS